MCRSTRSRSNENSTPSMDSVGVLVPNYVGFLGFWPVFV